MPRTFKLVLEYDGAAFEGWQTQPEGHRTVQGELIAALRRLGTGELRVMGAGRTDAGVHAEGQVASVRMETRLDADTLMRAVNGSLPKDVVVLVCDQRRCSPVVIGEAFVPLLLRILHGDLRLAAKTIEGVADRDPEPLENAGNVGLLQKVEFGSFYYECHGDQLRKTTIKTAANTMFARAISKKKTQPRRMSWS